MFEPVYSDVPRTITSKGANWIPAEIYDSKDPSSCLCHVTLNFPTTNRLDRPANPADSVTTSPLYRLLKSYLISLEHYGLFFVDEKSQHVENVNNKRMYSRIGMIIQFMNAFFYGLPFLMTFEFESLNVVMLVASLYALQNGFTAAISYNMCTQNSKFPKLFQNWSELIQCPTETARIEKYVIRRRKVYFVLAWIFNITFSIGWFLTVAGFFGDIMPTYFLETVPSLLVYFMRLLFITTNFLGTVTWSLPSGLFVVLCLGTCRLLDTYNDVLSKAVDFILHGGIPASVKDPFKAESFRLKHQKVLRLIETINAMFGLFIMSMLLVNMAILCFASYMFLFVCAPPYIKILEAVWTGLSTVWLLLLCIAGAKLHSSAHKPYDELHAVPLNNMSTDNIVKLIVFLNRVGGPEIGISAWGFSILSKNFISTLASIFLSYFFLLVQFQSPNGLTSCPEDPMNETFIEPVF